MSIEFFKPSLCGLPGGRCRIICVTTAHCLFRRSGPTRQSPLIVVAWIDVRCPVCTDLDDYEYFVQTVRTSTEMAVNSKLNIMTNFEMSVSKLLVV